MYVYSLNNSGIWVPQCVVNSKKDKRYEIEYINSYLKNNLSKSYPEYYPFLISGFEYFINSQYNYSNQHYKSPSILISPHMSGKGREFLKAFISGVIKKYTHFDDYIFNILQQSDVRIRLLQLRLTSVPPDKITNHPRFDEAKKELFESINNIINTMKTHYGEKILSTFENKTFDILVD